MMVAADDARSCWLVLCSSCVHLRDQAFECFSFISFWPTTIFLSLCFWSTIEGPYLTKTGSVSTRSQTWERNTVQAEGSFQEDQEFHSASRWNCCGAPRDHLPDQEKAGLPLLQNKSKTEFWNKDSSKPIPLVCFFEINEPVESGSTSENILEARRAASLLLFLSSAVSGLK